MPRTLGTTRYYPGNIPVNITSPDFWNRLLEFLRREFFSVYRGLESVNELPELHVQPERLKDGLMVFADGTDWNPGQGRGVYFYDGGVWYKFTVT